MRTTTISQHISLSAAALGTVTAIMAVLSVFSINTLTGSTDSLSQSSLPALGQKGSHELDQVASAIKAITEGAGQVGHLLDEVKEASSQQAQGIAQISRVILEVNRITQQTAAGAEESAVASEDLNEQTRLIQSTLQTLQALAGFARRQAVLPARELQTPRSTKRAALPPAVSKEPQATKKFAPVQAAVTLDSTELEDFLPLGASQAGPEEARTFRSF